MILIENFKEVIAQIETERGVSKDSIISAIEQALAAACKRNLNDETEIEATLDENGEATLYEVKEVVAEVEDAVTQIDEKAAKKLDKSLVEGDFFRTEIKPPEFGRLAAQTAKQVIVQRIREAEKNAIYDEFINRVDSLIVGTVQRIENQNYLINLGRAEAILNYRNQIQGEVFSLKDKVRVYIESVEQSPKGAMIRISRTHPGLLKKLFEAEIPEIKDGIIEIKSISREPGKRAKVAVKTNNPLIGAVGTCVGHMGSRIQTIIKELGFEKIDVLEWSEDPVQFISNALKPAQISQVIVTNEDEKTAVVIVPKDQLSLAIGKAGINVRLSVKLTDWRMDIFSEEEYRGKATELKSDSHLSIVERIKQDRENQINDPEPDAEVSTETAETETEAVSEDATAEETPTEEAATEEAPAADDSASVEEAAAEEVPAEEEIAQEAASEEVAIQEVVQEDVVAEEAAAPVEDSVAADTPPELPSLDEEQVEG